jgi:phage-related protein
MGTSMEMIQNAYQGFAKQNYTMLDNLKLGYGGTKEEMQRLLDDAEKISGIKYDISSFADVTQAIHVIQTELGITGTTALEASSTIQGSASAMKASWQNLLTGMADPTQDFNALLQNFISSVGTFAGNLLPVVQTAAQGVLQMVQGLLPQLVSMIAEMLPMVVEGVTGIISGIVEALPQIVDAIAGVLPQISTAILNMLPQILEAGIQILLSLIQGLTQALPQLITMLPEIINTIITVLIENLPLIIAAGIQLLIAIVTGLSEAIPQLIDYVPTIIDTLITTLLDNLPLIIDCAIQLLVALINGLIQALPQLVAMTPQIIITIVTTLKANLPMLLEAGKTLLTSVINGIKSILSKIGEVGKNIVQGLWQGIINTKDWLLNKIKSFAHTITDGIKSFFGIHSPSRVMRDEVGKQIPAGMAIGIDKAKNLVTKATQALVTDTRSEVQKVLDDMNEEMLESEKLYAEESIRLKDSTVEADKEYLDNLKKTAETERKLYDARQKDIENLKKNIVDAYSEMANEALSSIEDLEKEQQNLEQKLAEYGGLMVEKTKKVRGKEVTYNVLADLDEQKETLQNYYDMLQTVKERGNVPKEFFNVLREMGIDEGLEYANALLELSDEDFAEYIKDWEEKQKLSKNISKALYEDEATELATSINDEFESLKDDMFGIGKDSAGEFGDGFIQQLKFLVHDIQYMLQSALGGVTIGGIGPVISGEGDVIKVPALARGGIAPRKMLAMIGERGREAVLPLENNTGWMDALADRISTRMGSASSTVVLEVDGREFGRAVVEQGNKENRRIGSGLVIL